ncbi:TIGR02281 family clan AA aspartic protease [Aromatoleum toluclasticum]|uniref:retropepsin-like aspartic protease family protein n=1 Tax=Aromatoleum toluclasticum TaxID=92003 RepID=UPI001D17F981|nr:TIGR02281 family clan AA aspartic protease [Aromatoleum toluclasticum]MCC4116817.1 TIGR02281 family clan AA aspartic protease [Aromatoleum toluclasticum]
MMVRLVEMYRIPLLVAAVAAWHPVLAADVELVGLFGRKAVLVVDGGAPRTLAVGEQTRDGLRLLDVTEGAAIVEIGGARQKVALGAGPVRGSSGEQGGAAAVSLVADARGHHFSSGSINGASVRFLVDTGASMVSMGASDARRAGIDFHKGVGGVSQTASGPAKVWKVRLDTVRVGDVTLHGVDGLIHENDLPFVLLGMSFLSRMDMQREGDRLTLRKRF